MVCLKQKPDTKSGRVNERRGLMEKQQNKLEKGYIISSRMKEMFSFLQGSDAGIEALKCSEAAPCNSHLIS